MKTKIVWFVLLLSLVMRVGAMAKPIAQKPLRAARAAELKAFDALYAKSDAAILRRDVKYLRNTMTLDFKKTSLSGKTFGRAEYIGNMTDMYRQIVKVTLATSTVQNLGFRGQEALVIVSRTGEFTLRAEDRKTHRLRFVTRSIENWISTRQGWMLQAVTDTASRRFMDGRELARR